MALSQDEQRVLAEIERRLTADDPGLATCLMAFRRPGPATVLRSPRARIIGSLFTVLLVAMVSLMVYAMIPFRTHNARTPSAPPASSTGLASATGAGIQAQSTQPPSSRPASSSAGATPQGKSATPTAGSSAATSQAQPRNQAADHASPATGPLRP
jgi:hypothetical protein